VCRGRARTCFKRTHSAYEHQTTIGGAEQSRKCTKSETGPIVSRKIARILCIHAFRVLTALGSKSIINPDNGAGRFNVVSEKPKFAWAELVYAWNEFTQEWEITMIKLAFGFVFAVSCFGGTFIGQISDSSCGASHGKMSGQHGKSDRDCTLACVKGGSKYVFVSGGSVYQIENQSLADLEKRAGQKVEITADMKGDTVTISKISRK
jgi:hypothetical protein